MYDVYTTEDYRWAENRVWKKTVVSDEWNGRPRRNDHYVAFAIPGLTYAAAYFQLTKIRDYKELFYRINQTDEPGTLDPEYNATFLPVHRANYYNEVVEHRPCTTEESLKRYFGDVCIANSMMNADTIVLDFRDIREAVLFASYVRIALDLLTNKRGISKIIVLH